MLDDLELLREYAEGGAEEPFRTLVERHARMVYGAALRMCGDHSVAEDVTQGVFILLARKARTLRTGTLLAGWLYRTTRFVTLEALRNQQRRQKHDTSAAQMNETTTLESSQVAPLLEEVMNRLPAADRDAIVLRFLEEKSFAEVAQLLGTSEAAAKMRVSRALEKLRAAFTRCGVQVSVAVLLAGVSACGASAAPAGLTTSVSAAALSQALSGTAAILVKGTIKAMTWNKIRAVSAVAGLALLLGSASLMIFRHHSKPSSNEANSRRVATFEPMQGEWQGAIMLHAGTGTPVISEACFLTVQISQNGRSCDIEMRVEGPNGPPQQVHHYVHTLNEQGDQMYTVSDPRTGRGDGNGTVTEKFNDPAAGEWHMALRFPFPGNRGVMEGRWERHRDELFIRSHDEFYPPDGSNHIYADLRLQRVTATARR